MAGERPFPRIPGSILEEIVREANRVRSRTRLRLLPTPTALGIVMISGAQWRHPKKLPYRLVLMLHRRECFRRRWNKCRMLLMRMTGMILPRSSSCRAAQEPFKFNVMLSDVTKNPSEAWGFAGLRACGLVGLWACGKGPGSPLVFCAYVRFS